MELIISAVVGLVAMIVSFKLIARHLGTTTCIDCNKDMKIKDAIKAQMRNKDMYRCRECSDKVRFTI